MFAFGLAKEIGAPDPFKMLEEMPDYVWRHWMAYQRLRDDDYRQQVEWRVLKETDEVRFREEQEHSVLSVIRYGKAVAAAKS